MSKPGRKEYLKLEDKLSILEFLEDNPKISMARVAEIYTERLQRKVNKMHVCRIKQNADKIRMAPEIHKSHVMYDKPDVLEFEDAFNDKFNEPLAKGPVTYSPMGNQFSYWTMPVAIK